MTKQIINLMKFLLVKRPRAVESDEGEGYLLTDAAWSAGATLLPGPPASYEIAPLEGHSINISEFR